MYLLTRRSRFQTYKCINCGDVRKLKDNYLCKKSVAVMAGYHIQMAGERGEGRYKLLGPGGPEGGPGPNYIAYVFVFSVVSVVIR
jgi:hypothetical protein